MKIWLAALLWTIPGLALDLPEGFKESLYADEIPRATTISFAPDGRPFVCQQDGLLRIVKDGVVVEQPVLTVSSHVEGEHGLLGVAFDPDFEKNQLIYIYYTFTGPPIRNRISRFQLNGDVAGEETVLFELDDVGKSVFHVGALLDFGPDGKLYAGSGDNAGWPNMDNSQRLTNLFGKLLRLNSDGTIPEDNPFYGQTEGKNRAIYALGLRNPYTWSFEPGTNRLFVNDIGATSFEEINDVKPGGNYGWPFNEGYTDDPRHTTPLFAYAHGPELPQGCAITGGAFYPKEGGNFPEAYRGKYFFSDYCNGGWIRMMDPATNSVSNFASKIAQNPTGLRVGPDGSLYYPSRWREGIYRISYQGK